MFVLELIWMKLNLAAVLMKPVDPHISLLVVIPQGWIINSIYFCICWKVTNIHKHCIVSARLCFQIQINFKPNTIVDLLLDKILKYSNTPPNTQTHLLQRCISVCTGAPVKEERLNNTAVLWSPSRHYVSGLFWILLHKEQCKKWHRHDHCGS